MAKDRGWDQYWSKRQKKIDFTQTASGSLGLLSKPEGVFDYTKYLKKSGYAPLPSPNNGFSYTVLDAAVVDLANEMLYKCGVSINAMNAMMALTGHEDKIPLTSGPLPSYDEYEVKNDEDEDEDED